MNRWFETAFGADYIQRYAHRDSKEAARTLELFQTAVELERGCKVLDLGCGSGRHSRELDGAGYDVTGVDLSEELIREGLSLNRGRKVKYVKGEMNNIPFPGHSFDAVVNLFTSFGYYAEDQENELVVAEISRVLKPNGFFFFDFLNEKFVRKNLDEVSRRKMPNGTRIIEKRRIDEESGRVEKRMQLLEEDGSLHERFESVRLFSREKLKVMFHTYSLEIQQEFGDYDGSIWNSDSPRLILVAKKK